MIDSISKIIEGWRNKLFPPEELKEIIEIVSKERMNICDVCEFNSKNRNKKSVRPDVHCTKCGCTLSAKTACLSCDCPLEIPKWKAIISQEEERRISDEK